MKYSKHKFLHTTLGIAMICLPHMLSVCHAEGDGNLGRGAFGVNRRVRTTPNQFVGIQGTFTTPVISVPSPNTTGNRPTFYLGSGSDDSTEVDAGVQWEPPRQGVVGGWTLFVSSSMAPTRGDAYTNPQALDSKGLVVPWRSDPNRPGGAVNPNVTSFVLTHRVHQFGSVSLEVNAVGADYQPAPASIGYPSNGLFYWNNPVAPRPGDPDPYNHGRTPIRVYQPYRAGHAQAGQTNLDGLSMKRVIGITQADPGGGNAFLLDNSFMLGCRFSDALLATRTETPQQGGFTHNFNTQFSLDNVDQRVVDGVLQTGYSPNGRDNNLPPKWIVDFAFAGMAERGPLGTGPITDAAPGGSDPTGSYRNEIIEDRYRQEVVNISLLDPSLAVGEAVIPGFPTPR